MLISALSVRCDDRTLWVELADGRVLGVPLDWFPRLKSAGAEQRAQVVLVPGGQHWPELDEDISIAGLLAGQGDHRRNVA